MLAGKVALRRGFATAAAQAQPSPFSSAYTDKVSVLPSGLTVASVDLNGSVSSLVLAYRAGSRYQQPDEGGFAHHIRNNFGSDSPSYLGVKLLWQLGSIGGSLTGHASKDLLAVQTSVFRDDVPVAISLLGEFGQPAFKAWDVDATNVFVQRDLQFQEPYDIALDLLHKAAYRSGPLANSVIAAPHEVGKASFKKLQAYAAARLLSSEAVLVGVNVEHNDLLNYASRQAAIPQGRGTEKKQSPYIGGDDRLSGPTNVAHVLVAGEGAPLTDVKGVAVQHVLANLVNNQTGLKFSGLPGNSVTGATILKAANHRPVGIAAVNVSHSDAGLFGVYVATDGQYAEPIVRAAVEGLRALANVDSTNVEAAKQAARLGQLLHFDQPSNVAIDQAAHILATGVTQSATDLAKEIQNVTVDDVKKAAQKATSKLSVAAYGKVHQVPYADKL